MAGRLLQLVCGLTAVMLADVCFAQHPIPESERWATITHPGNAPHLTGFPEFGRLIGRVDYEYQIGRTEMTGAEWFEFVVAFAPYVDTNESSATMFTSNLVTPDSGGPGAHTYELNAGGENYPARVGWRYAARYCNWLHNNKATNREAFENGAYDTSTFVTIPDSGGQFTDQLTHNVGARYWIPTEDEWVKAAYFDPDRFGPGLPGYWNYPHGSDSQPIPGRPNSPTEPGQTSAGWEFPEAEPPVAAYLGVQSPWGLLDLSGSAAEWNEQATVPAGQALPRTRQLRGTDAFHSLPQTGPFTRDYIDWTDGSGMLTPEGFRLARAVPAPGVLLGAMPALILFIRRQRAWLRRTNPKSSWASRRFC